MPTPNWALLIYNTGMKIAFDLDEVLAGFTVKVLEFHNAIYGTSVVFSEVKDFYLDDIWGGTRDEAVRKVYDFFKTDYFRDIPPLPGSQLMIKKLKQEGHELIVITGRQAVIRRQTEDWLARHFPGIFSEIYLTNHHSYEGKTYRKSDFLRQSQAKVYIDDHLDYVLDCAKTNVQILLYDYPWNQTTHKLPENVKRVYSWPQIYRAIKQVEKIEVLL